MKFLRFFCHNIQYFEQKDIFPVASRQTQKVECHLFQLIGDVFALFPRINESLSVSMVLYSVFYVQFSSTFPIHKAQCSWCSKCQDCVCTLPVFMFLVGDQPEDLNLQLQPLWESKFITPSCLSPVAAVVLGGSAEVFWKQWDSVGSNHGCLQFLPYLSCQ